MMLNAPPGCGPEWWSGVWQAWQLSKLGAADEAERLYREADAVLDGCELNPELSLCRHNPGSGSGTVRPVAPTEREVVSCVLPSHDVPVGGRQLLGIPDTENFRVPAPCEGDGRRHIMVLSTGRCGTVSLFRLFQGSNLEPYHSYWFMPHPCTRWEYLCRLYEGKHDDMAAAEEWAACRRAEWLGEKPMIGLNHADTVFAPLFAAIHPNARFIYLRRDPGDVYLSFESKAQWQGGSNHIRPIYYGFDGGFRFSLPHIEDSKGSFYHIVYTGEFCRAFGEAVGDRMIRISADRLFAQDREEIARLLEFTEAGIDIDQAVAHFGTKINEKAHLL